MKAGRELDALVAEKVMGLIAYKVQLVAPPPRVRTMEELQRIGVPLPRYSTNIADAWEVVRKMGMVLIENSGEAFGKLDEWNVQFVGHDKEGEPHWVSESAETVELAICLAALKAVSQEGQANG